MVLTTLAHHIDIEFLRKAWRRTRKDGAVGVDGLTAKEYNEELERNLDSLLQRFKSGTYYAPPVRRVYIPKPGRPDEKRALGIPGFEDKVLQRAVAMILEAVYEQDFLPCSYGFRPRKSAHQALEALRENLMEMKGGMVLEVDIRKFFDTLDHGHLRRILDQRVRDGVIRRMIDKWLKAGVLEKGRLSYPEEGTPQGGVISPVLANIFLHTVLDEWFEEEIRPRLRGAAYLIRFADDAVLVFESEEDARRVLAVLPKRLGKFGLTLHPQKTRLVPFRRPPFTGGTNGRGGSGVFDMLGFTHHWGRSRNGYWVIKRKTASSRFRQKLREITQWCRKNRHMPVKKQYEKLVLKLRGHYGYYGITGNSHALGRFRHAVEGAWRKWLDRRSQRRHMPWARFALLLQCYPLPRAVCVHSSLRLAVKP